MESAPVMLCRPPGRSRSDLARGKPSGGVCFYYQHTVIGPTMKAKLLPDSGRLRSAPRLQTWCFETWHRFNRRFFDGRLTPSQIRWGATAGLPRREARGTVIDI